MKRVGIITINDNNNYGNRLQNYAVQEVLKKKNVRVETIINQKNCKKIYIKEHIKLLLPLKKFNRIRNFYRFNKLINFSNVFLVDNNKDGKKINLMYDTFFVGSDQVWNPNFKRLSDIDFLTFADKEKRNSFSASFGISTLSLYDEERCKKYLKEFKNVSVREDKGKELVETLTGRNDIEILVDPTMLLSKDEWDIIIKKPKQMKEEKKYILNYFLGDIPKDRKLEIERIAKEYNCEIINILDPKDQYYSSGPSEFIYLEKNAFLVCTDSFHSSVFAFLYNVPFIVFNREDKLASMNSRLETLLLKFNLKNRTFNDKNITYDNLNQDYTESYKILEEERKKADLFLKNALSINNQNKKGE